MGYPNIEAMASGTISGRFEEWPKVRPEANALLAEVAALREENARLRDALLRRGISQAPCDICGYCGPEYYQPMTHHCIGESYEARRASGSTR